MKKEPSAPFFFAAPSLSSLFPNFSAEKIDSLMKGNTVEAYTCYGDKIADIEKPRPQDGHDRVGDIMFAKTVSYHKHTSSPELVRSSDNAAAEPSPNRQVAILRQPRVCPPGDDQADA